MKPAAVLLCMAGLLSAAPAGVTIWKSRDLRKNTPLGGKPFASESLGRFGNHHALLAHREGNGQAELHQTESDLFVVESGTATLVTGGKILRAKTTAAHEIRGASIENGVRKALEPGDIVEIPAGTPHQLFVPPGQQFTYFVMKVEVR